MLNQTNFKPIDFELGVDDEKFLSSLLDAINRRYHDHQKLVARLSPVGKLDKVLTIEAHLLRKVFTDCLPEYFKELIILHLQGFKAPEIERRISSEFTLTIGMINSDISSVLKQLADYIEFGSDNRVYNFKGMKESLQNIINRRSKRVTSSQIIAEH
jgi:hypothetical protein